MTDWATEAVTRGEFYLMGLWILWGVYNKAPDPHHKT